MDISTVKDLINALSVLPQDNSVFIQDTDTDWLLKVVVYIEGDRIYIGGNYNTAPTWGK